MGNEIVTDDIDWDAVGLDNCLKCGRCAESCSCALDALVGCEVVITPKQMKYFVELEDG